MSDNVLQFLQSKTSLIVGFVVIVMVLERVFPKARPLARAHLDSAKALAQRLFKNVSMTVLNAILSPLVVIPVSALAARWALDWRPDWWSGYGGLALDIIVLDVWIYWWHRLNHVVPFLWRFHEVHHLDQFLDASSALRFHFGEVFLSSLARAVIILLMGIPLQSVIVFEVVLMFSAVFHHSNLNLPPQLEKIMSLFVVTPSIHWVHHHAIRADTDSNYCAFLSVWDRIFASRSRTKRTADMPIGVERRSDKGLLNLVTRPFDFRKE